MLFYMDIVLYWNHKTNVMNKERISLTDNRMASLFHLTAALIGVATESHSKSYTTTFKM